MLLKPLLAALVLSSAAACATLPETKTASSLPDADWATCVPTLPTDKETPTTPYPRTLDYPWMSRNEWCGRVLGIRHDPVRTSAQLGLMGDSITQGWPKELLAEKFGSQKPIKMGIGGDRTQNLLWRIDHDELNDMNLQDLVLLIGTNNLGAGDKPEEVVQGIKLVIDRTRRLQPEARITVMAIFPRGQSPSDPLRDQIAKTNQLLAKAARQWQVEYLDIGSQLLEKDGSISPEIMNDFVHLTKKGYQVWATALANALRR